ncbi:MAG: tetratricopeptide repeat-containing protein, partial [Rhodobacteraceae bacterium]|nr:tetratricopeptide repeat-containing protein [Paracoccaceae bacterium]
VVRFPASDLRRVTSAANVAHVLREAGLGTASRRAYRRAYVRWAGLTAGIEDISIKPRARSSLFHLRMEALHWESYKMNRMKRLHRFMQETSECLGCLVKGHAAPHRLYERWKGEKLPIYDDTRKILSACLLVIATQRNGDK